MGFWLCGQLSYGDEAEIVAYEAECDVTSAVARRDVGRAKLSLGFLY